MHTLRQQYETVTYTLQGTIPHFHTTIVIQPNCYSAGLQLPARSTLFKKTGKCDSFSTLSLLV
jgi:hypothetical protein